MSAVDNTASTVSASGSGAAVARAGAPLARVRLAAGDGAARGTATISDAGSGLDLRLEAIGLPPGTHGVHLHAVGRCDPPGFESGGPHWNPTAAQHGRDNPQGAHSGDLPNLAVAADGRGVLEFTVAGATAAGLMDADGSALIVHAKADDYRTDPSGNSGARIACGVVEPAR